MIERFAVLSLALALAGSLAQAATPQGSAIFVNTTAEATADGQCSLREAITAANTNAPVDGCPAGVPGLDTILVPPATYTLTLFGPDENANATGDLDIAEDLVVRGLEPVRGADDDRGPPAQATIVASSGDRVFHVLVGRSARLENLVIEGGRVGGLVFARGLVSGNAGGGILSDGSVTLSDCVVRDNRVFGVDADASDPDVRGGGPGPAGAARGGGILSVGPLGLIRTRIESNRATGGDGAFSQPGGDAVGGGVEALGGLLVQESVFFDNEALGGTASGVGDAPGGRALGGALALSGSAQIFDSSFEANVAVASHVPLRAGGDVETGAPAPAEPAPAGGFAPPEALGGAIAMRGGASLTVARSGFYGNAVFGGRGLPGGGTGGAAFGGAIHHGAGMLSVGSSTFAGQVATGGIGGVALDLRAGEGTLGGPVGGAGGDAAGGAIYTTRPGPSPVAIVQSSFVDNEVVGGEGGAGAAPRGLSIPGGSGGDARGGHLAEESSPLRGFPSFVVGNTILAAGTATGGAGGFGDPTGASGAATGAACDASLASQLGSIESPTDTCGLLGGSGDLVGVTGGALDLGPVQDNGGPTSTALPGDGSDALDFAVVAECPRRDQRGWYRLDGTCDSGAADSGAFEPIFLDGFETGNANAWTDTVGL